MASASFQKVSPTAATIGASVRQSPDSWQPQKSPPDPSTQVRHSDPSGRNIRISRSTHSPRSTPASASPPASASASPQPSDISPYISSGSPITFSQSATPSVMSQDSPACSVE